MYLFLFYAHWCFAVGIRSPGNWNYRQLWAAMWVLGIEPGPLEEQSVLLTPEPSSSPWDIYFLFVEILFGRFCRVAFLSQNLPSVTHSGYLLFENFESICDCYLLYLLCICPRGHLVRVEVRGKLWEIRFGEADWPWPLPLCCVLQDIWPLTFELLSRTVLLSLPSMSL